MQANTAPSEQDMSWQDTVRHKSSRERCTRKDVSNLAAFYQQMKQQKGKVTKADVDEFHCTGERASPPQPTAPQTTQPQPTAPSQPTKPQQSTTQQTTQPQPTAPSQPTEPQQTTPQQTTQPQPTAPSQPTKPPPRSAPETEQERAPPLPAQNEPVTWQEAVKARRLSRGTLTRDEVSALAQWYKQRKHDGQPPTRSQVEQWIFHTREQQPKQLAQTQVTITNPPTGPVEDGRGSSMRGTPRVLQTAPAPPSGTSTVKDGYAMSIREVFPRAPVVPSSSDYAQERIETPASLVEEYLRVQGPQGEQANTRVTMLSLVPGNERGVEVAFYTDAKEPERSSTVGDLLRLAALPAHTQVLLLQRSGARGVPSVRSVRPDETLTDLQHYNDSELYILK